MLPLKLHRGQHVTMVDHHRRSTANEPRQQGTADNEFDQQAMDSIEGRSKPAQPDRPPRRDAL